MLLPIFKNRCAKPKTKSAGHTPRPVYKFNLTKSDEVINGTEMSDHLTKVENIISELSFRNV